MFTLGELIFITVAVVIGVLTMAWLIRRYIS